MCWNKGRLCWKIANLFYFCHLKKLVRPETFGTYYVRMHACLVIKQELMVIVSRRHHHHIVIITSSSSSSKSISHCSLSVSSCVLVARHIWFLSPVGNVFVQPANCVACMRPPKQAGWSRSPSETTAVTVLWSPQCGVAMLSLILRLATDHLLGQLTQHVERQSLRKWQLLLVSGR